MIDTHCHLTLKDYPDINEVINKMGNNKIIVNGTNDEENKRVIELINKYPNVYGAIGIHPEEIDKITTNSFKYIEENINNSKIVAIGEIGLDYYYETDKEKQKEIFIKQIELANRYNKTVVIHSRDAIKDTIDILNKHKNKNIKLDIHCYAGSVESAKELIKLNSMFGIGGIVTFKNSKNIKQIVEEIDLKYLLLETDSPYLSPEPYRGKRNEPYNILYVAQKIAEIKSLPLEEVLKVTTENAIRQFDLD
ncbi:MAG: TatD family hydrolase [Bacilli bacterium]|nr:TatD family hydrolase [Bacilli bacterium]